MERCESLRNWTEDVGKCELEFGSCRGWGLHTSRLCVPSSTDKDAASKRINAGG